MSARHDTMSSSNDNTDISRWNAIRGTAAVATAGILGTGIFLSATQPAVAVTDGWTSRDITIDTNDGEVQEVLIAPTMTVQWENFTEDVDGIDITITASIDHSADFIFELENINSDTNDDVVSFETGEDTFGNSGGTAEIELVRKDITNGGEITEDDVPSGLSSGEEEESDSVGVKAEINVRGIGSESAMTAVSDSYFVTVKNPDSDTSVDGESNTDGR